MKLKRCIILLFCLGTIAATAQPIATFTVDMLKKNVSFPVEVFLSGITHLPAEQLKLYKVSGRNKRAIAFQIDNSHNKTIWWMAEGVGKQTYELVKEHNLKDNQSHNLVSNAQHITIQAGGKSLIQYNNGVVSPPEGVDSAFTRSGFFHPVWTPNGNVLTQIHPKDHYHHFGLWNPWTRVGFRDKEVDFWNLKDRKGTVRFNAFSDMAKGDVFAGFTTLQDHVVFNQPEEGKETVALQEACNIKAFSISDKAWILDFTSTYTCATQDYVTLLEYRYGGLGLRANQYWHNGNSKVISSEGHNRKTADGGLAKWCFIEGDLEKGKSGILFMSHPTNYNHPEPMRVWPEDQYERGDVFFNFSPTKNKDWTIHPHQSETLKYRMLIFDGTITADEAEQAWQAFAHPPIVIVDKK